MSLTTTDLKILLKNRSDTSATYGDEMGSDKESESTDSLILSLLSDHASTDSYSTAVAAVSDQVLASAAAAAAAASSSSDPGGWMESESSLSLLTGLESSTLMPNLTNPFPEPRSPDKLEFPYQICLIILYSLSAVASFCGNLTVIIVLMYGRRSSSELRKYLINLAATDIIMGLACIPYT